MTAEPLVLLPFPDKELEGSLASLGVGFTPDPEANVSLILIDADASSERPSSRLARWRAGHPELPVLAVGRDVGPRVVVEWIRAGARDWVARPVDSGELRSALDRAHLQSSIADEGRHLRNLLEGQGRRVEEEHRLLSRQLAAMGSQLEAANAQLAAAHRELQGRVAQLVMLYRIGRDLSNHPNWDEALSRFLDSLAEFLGATGTGLLLTSQLGRCVQARLVKGMDDTSVENACTHLANHAVDEGDEPYLLPLEEFGREDPVPCVDRSEPWSTTVLPLRHRDRTLGYLLIEKEYASGEAIDDDVYFLITVQTILTEEVAQAQAVSELRKLQQFQQRTLDHVGSGIVTLDDQGHLLYANRKGSELLGGPRLGTRLNSQLRAGGEATDLATWGASAEPGAPRAGEAWLDRGDGDPVSVSLRASRIAGELPGEYHSIFILEDLRAARELEAERRRAARQDELLIMAAEWAHDVRTPLTGILHSAELLSGALPAESPKRRHFEVVKGEVARLNDLVSHFLGFARPVHLKRAAAELGRLAAEVVELLHPQAADRGITLALEAEPEGTPGLQIDLDQVKQVVLNLVTNALDASPAAGRVVLRVHTTRLEFEELTGGPPRGAAVLEVEDLGPGVSPEHIDRLFIPFFTTKPEGTGLGLAISEKVMRAHRGHLRYERRGKRTVMRAVFPLVDGPTVSSKNEEDKAHLRARG